MPARNPSGADRTRSASHPDTPPGPRHGRSEPIGVGWNILTAVVAVMAALIALGGMTLSYRAVSSEMIPAFGVRWAWLVPIVVDLTVFVFSGVDLVLARLDMGHPLARWTVYGATVGTVWLNYSAGGDAAGRIAHVLMPSIWVVFVELMRHVVRRQVNLATGGHREPVPVARWLLAPFSTLALWRRMVLWHINSYPAALTQERVRLARIAEVREKHGRLWRWRVDGLTRLSIALGEVQTQTPETILHSAPAGPAVTEQSTPPTQDRSSSYRAVADGAERSANRRSTAEQNGGVRSQSARSGAAAAHSDDALECLTAEETRALDQLVESCAPRIPSQGAIRNALPLGFDGRRCGATRAIRIQKALRARAEHPDRPDPLSDALDTEMAVNTA